MKFEVYYNTKKMQFWTIDVFSNQPFKGNAAGVFLCEKPLSERTYEKLALELFQSETAFITPPQNENGHFGIRLFSPYGENKAPGHAILAAAYVLWEDQNYPQNKPIYFETQTTIYKVLKNDSVISMVFPRSTVTPTVSPDRLFKALNTLPVSVSECGNDLIVELHSEEELRNLEPNFPKLSTIEANRIIVTCEEESKSYDFVSRVFAPRLGNDEEAANIQSYCDLAAFWETRINQTSFKAKQLGYRSGRVMIDLNEDTVTLSGNAVIVAKGRFLVDMSQDDALLR